LPYLRTAVLNGARSRGRRSAVERRHRQPGAPPSSSAEELALLSEEHREVLALLDTLPRRQREVLVLRYWLDQSEAEDWRLICGGSLPAGQHATAISAVGSWHEVDDDAGSRTVTRTTGTSLSPAW
jgi:hypothetical protein